MFRLTATLTAAIFILMVVYGDPRREGRTVDVPAAPRPPIETRPGDPSGIGAPIVVHRGALVSRAEATPEESRNQATAIPAIAPSVRPEAPVPRVVRRTEPDIWFVTGDRVNVREGPSTDDPVIGQLSRGATAELLEFRVDGWARIRLGDIGEGFISGEFLSLTSP
ncbi:MAG: SH3 domain-containing protein [Pseudomonadota bacterium]